MGKKIALLVLFTGYGLILYSQNIILIRAGYNQSFFYEIGDFDDYRYGPPEFDSKPAYYFGLTYYKNKGGIIHWESWLDFTKKNLSMYYKSGGLGGWGGCDCDYQLKYIDISFYPVIELGKRLRVAGSARPSLGILLYSHYEGESTYQTMYMTAPVSEQVSGSASHKFLFFNLDIIYNLRLEYNLTNRVGILLEGQYSRGIFNILRGDEIKINFNNYSAGTGIALTL